MIRAVLFDLDGTLADSLADLATACDRTLEKFGYPRHSREEYRMFVGNGIPKLMERALPAEYRTPEEVERALAVFLADYGVHYADQTTAYDGMPQLLDVLREKGIRIAVITNKAQEMAEKVVQRLYGDRFDLIFGKREVFLPKPDPAAAWEAMRVLSVSPQECLFVGDSAVDMKTAANCGATPIGVLWGYRDRAELINNGAQILLESPSQLLPFLEEKS